MLLIAIAAKLQKLSFSHSLNIIKKIILTFYFDIVQKTDEK